PRARREAVRAPAGDDDRRPLRVYQPRPGRQLPADERQLWPPAAPPGARPQEGRAPRAPHRPRAGDDGARPDGGRAARGGRNRGITMRRLLPWLGALMVLVNSPIGLHPAGAEPAAPAPRAEFTDVPA